MLMDSGCYPNSDPAHYRRIQPDRLYKLDYIPIEVRSKYDPYVALAGQNYVITQETPMLSTLATGLLTLSFILAFITFVLYIRVRKSNGQES